MYSCISKMLSIHIFCDGFFGRLVPSPRTNSNDIPCNFHPRFLFFQYLFFPFFFVVLQFFSLHFFSVATFLPLSVVIINFQQTNRTQNTYRRENCTGVSNVELCNGELTHRITMRKLLCTRANILFINLFIQDIWSCTRLE